MKSISRYGFVILLLCFSPAGGEANNVRKTYTNSRFGLTLQYPAEWEVGKCYQQTDLDKCVSFTQKFDRNVVSFVQVNLYNKDMQKILSQDEDVRKVDDNWVMINPRYMDSDFTRVRENNWTGLSTTTACSLEDIYGETGYHTEDCSTTFASRGRRTVTIDTWYLTQPEIAKLLASVKFLK